MSQIDRKSNKFLGHNNGYSIIQNHVLLVNFQIFNVYQTIIDLSNYNKSV